MTSAGSELGNFFVTAKNIAGAHGVGAIDAAIITLRGRIAEVFGEDAGKKVDNFVGTIKGIPSAFTGISDALTGIRKGFAHFVIDLSTLPGLDDKFKDSAASARQFLGMPALDPARLPDGRPSTSAPHAVDALGSQRPRAQHQHPGGRDGAEPDSPSDQERMAHVIATAIATAQYKALQRTLNGTGPEAPGA